MLCVILSVNLREPPKGAHFLAKSLDDALELIKDPELTNKVDVVWIVGGSSVYKVSKIICEYKEIAYPLSASLPLNFEKISHEQSVLFL